MIRQLIVRPAAAREIRDAHRFYEQERKGLGDQFEGTLDSAIARILANPDMYSIVYRDIRRAIMRPFPYGLYYKVRRDVRYSVAVTHTSRDPLIWQRRA